MMLLAHHFEMAFIPVYVGQFALGIWFGWRMMSLVTHKLHRGGTDRLTHS